MTQSCQILAHLKRGESITSLEALNLYGSLRLAARVSELRKQGYDIKTKFEARGPKMWAVYKLNQTTPDAYKVQGELLSA